MYSTTLEQATNNIKQQTVLMTRCLSQHKLMDAFKHCSNMLSELRNPFLSPKQYYELYVSIYDSLSVMQQYLIDNHKTKHHLTDLYELVQYAGNIIPRLYLMITVGSAYLYIEDSPKLEICKDMIEMCNGIQQPIRGLFLRYYLSQRTKEFFEENQQSGSADNDEEKTEMESTKDSDIDKLFKIDFITSNFIEMNKLWVRLQFQGPLKEKDLRIRERQELQVLIGSNLVRLSAIMDLNDIDLYTENVLPRILEQVVQCRDIIAQEYLLEVILKIFPEEFQIKGLSSFLDCSLKLTPKTCISKIIITLIDRLIMFKERSLQYQDITLFNKFWKYLVTLDEERPDLPIKEFILIIDSLVKLTLLWDSVSPFPNIDVLFKFIYNKKDDYTITEEITNLFKKLLVITPSEESEESIQGLYFNLITQCDHYSEFLLSLSNSHIKLEIIEMIFKKILDSSISQRSITTKQDLISFTRILEPCLLDNPDLICKIFHLIKTDNRDLQLQFDLLNYCHHWLVSKNINLNQVLQSLIMEHWKLIRIYCKKNRKIGKDEPNDEHVFVKQLFKTVGKCIQEISNMEIQFKLNCNTANIADQLKLKDLAYDFFVNAFINFEEFGDSKLQYQSILYICQCLQKTRNLYASSSSSEQNYYETLITKCTLYGSKLLNKQDQCRTVLQCSHLWWCTEISILGEEEGVTNNFFRDGKRVLECLQRSLRVADSIMDNFTSCLIMIEIFNKVLYYFIHGETSYITIKYCNGLIELIKTNLQFLERESRVLTSNDENSGNNNNDINGHASTLSNNQMENSGIVTERDESAGNLFYGIGLDGAIIQSTSERESVKLSELLAEEGPQLKTTNSLLNNNNIPIDYFNRTLRYIKEQREVDDRFKLIVL